MGVRILTDGRDAIMYCSTTDWAFGPVVSDWDEHDGVERLEMFCEWLKSKGIPDPRPLSEGQLETKYNEWRTQEAAQWAAKEKVTEDD